mmetsp:Transcript_63859/g.160966  ORF Transcript_63859/g.160966 Transcript_63859/m.160966 type:complete len:101 (-) Transcript_63859:63-365(-)
MVQGSLKLNKNKQPKGGRHVQKLSKVDILAKKKKQESRGELAKSGAIAQGRKLGLRTEVNLAAKAQVEGAAQLSVVRVSPQVLAKVKGCSSVGLAAAKKK